MTNPPRKLTNETIRFIKFKNMSMICKESMCVYEICSNNSNYKSSISSAHRWQKYHNQIQMLFYVYERAHWKCARKHRHTTMTRSTNTHIHTYFISSMHFVIGSCELFIVWVNIYSKFKTAKWAKKQPKQRYAESVSKVYWMWEQQIWNIKRQILIVVFENWIDFENRHLNQL